MIDLLHTNYTKHVVPRPEAIDAAEQIFGRFQYIPHAEQLARLSLRVATGQSGAYLLDEDRRDLVRNHFLGNMHDSCAKTLTTSGIIAVNMVYAEVHD
ncbi:MAG TPA: hypothetical protein VGE13_01280, partial [Candidatus Saccharimonadales bacterium]